MNKGPTVVLDLIDQSGPFTHTEELLAFAREQLSPLNRRPKLLDLRCGTGRTAQVFAEGGWKVVGVDCSSDFEESWGPIREAHPNCEFIVSDCLPLLSAAERKFDLITAFDDLAIDLAQAENLSLALGFSIRSLRRGGLFIYQMDRSDRWTEDPIETAIEAGFREAWRTSIVDSDSPIDMGLDHRGSRDIFVARS